ncbi:serine/threonine-protein kinase [Terriglobus aquaticus]|uniref:Serine/threonine-protein kinase n=1 Tax=Terriglobus aquaticus TaxID=940139 RepID=A0ABW9KIU7_9BACT|nr:serine/threonine-protein kinase [Terriglobus aquaticus]
MSEARTDTAEIGERLQVVLGSRFLLERPLAIGGMATIFLLRHRLHNGRFVAKVLHPELVDRAGVLRSFRLEARHAALLGDHPNAVPVFDFGELDGLFFMLMPYIPGQDLDEVLAHEGPLDREECLHMAAQLSSLLCHAESQGVVHCDLTPGNVRRDGFGQYRLLDLGISQLNGPQDRPFVGGTPLYSSPEQLRGDALDIRSDLYSLGAVLGEALSGTPLFQGSSMKEIRNRHLNGVWRMPAALSEEDPLARLLRTLLSVDPAGRPQSAYELSGILHACGSTRPEFRSGYGPGCGSTKATDPSSTSGPANSDAERGPSKPSAPPESAGQRRRLTTQVEVEAPRSS